MIKRIPPKEDLLAVALVLIAGRLAASSSPLAWGLATFLLVAAIFLLYHKIFDDEKEEI